MVDEGALALAVDLWDAARPVAPFASPNENCTLVAPVNPAEVRADVGANTNTGWLVAPEDPADTSDR